MHIHILGICGTFMGGLAVLAKQLGYSVTGSDLNVYPPMSTQLEEQGISLYQGYDEAQFSPEPDLVIVGNALSRGNPAVEYILNRNIPYTSGPEWLKQALLKDRWVLAVAGTHGKTTTSSMLAWILQHAGLGPGFLIGGIPQNFGVSARLGQEPFFVIEADEYDTAFFDKRSKFVHYCPRTLIMNNLEFDHADIFPDLASIERQFHHVARIVPGIGKIIRPLDCEPLDRVIGMGCWSELATFGAGQADWSFRLLEDDGSSFEVYLQDQLQGCVTWGQTGVHNVSNGLAAIIAAHHAGVVLNDAIAALCEFQGAKRRMELRGTEGGVRVIDDFAHHPTAIELTLQGLRAQVGAGRVIAVIEPRSNTMRMGVHKDRLSASAAIADAVFWFEPENVSWGLQDLIGESSESQIFSDINNGVTNIVQYSQPGDTIIVMSNGGFGGIHQKLLTALESH